MKKIKFIFFNIIIIIFITAFFAFAGEVKNALPPIAPASVKATPVAKQTTIQNPAPPAQVPVSPPPPSPRRTIIAIIHWASLILSCPSLW